MTTECQKCIVGACQCALISLDEVAKHNSEKSCWVVVDGYVIDVTNFLKEHPGGKPILLAEAGKDATARFMSIHPYVFKFALTHAVGRLIDPKSNASKGASSNPSGLASAQGNRSKCEKCVVGKCRCAWIAMEEVAKHDSEESCWVVVDGHVIDVTKFLHEHPGGKSILLAQGGTDATDQFMAMHPHVFKLALSYSIGRLGDAGAAVSSSSSAAAAAVAVCAKCEGGACKCAWIDMDEVAKHNSEQSCWVVVDGHVIDVTKFLHEHPGGKSILLAQGGTDATDQFMAMHPHVMSLALSKSIGRVHRGADAAGSGDDDGDGSTRIDMTLDSNGFRSVLKLAPSERESWSSGGTAGELPAERAKATFDVVKMTNWLDGGAERTEKRRWILAPLKHLSPDDKFNMSRAELIEQHFRNFIGIHKPHTENGYLPVKGEVGWMGAHATNSGSLMPHMSLFLTTILGQADEEQMGWWMWRALTFQIVGAYSQTELGHGSNVRGLRTTATYDRDAEQFVLNTPTLQSMKWWNSGLGVAATHAAVYAQLIIDGKEYGVHVFMLQLRDEEHRLLPGIEAGDVGNKMGDGCLDTGYLRLRDVRVGRRALFAKRQIVESDGTYVKFKRKEGGSSKMHYLTMMSARAGMITIVGGKLAMAAMIATRYSCVRRQGFADRSQGVAYQSKELQIIDYQVQQVRLFKQIANAYAIKVVGQWMGNVFSSIDIAESTLSDDDIVQIHASSSGLKALCTVLADDGIEDARKCTGGHGYLLNSAIAAIALDTKWLVTAEGDLVILYLQTARYLVKQKPSSSSSSSSSSSGRSSFVDYLHLAEVPAPAAATRAADYCDLDRLIDLYRSRAFSLVREAQQELQERRDFNESSITLAAAARAHCYYFMLARFVDFVSAKDADVSCAAALRRLCTLWALTHIVDADGIAFHHIDGQQTKFVHQAIVQLLRQLRPDAIALVDAFDIPDCTHESTLGCYDGNVYEALYDGATRSRLNQQVPFRGYKKYLQPHLDLDFLKQRASL
jgi:acyl-CoA oxidase